MRIIYSTYLAGTALYKRIGDNYYVYMNQYGLYKFGQARITISQKGDDECYDEFIILVYETIDRLKENPK